MKLLECDLAIDHGLEGPKQGIETRRRRLEDLQGIHDGFQSRELVRAGSLPDPVASGCRRFEAYTPKSVEFGVVVP